MCEVRERERVCVCVCVCVRTLTVKSLAKFVSLGSGLLISILV